MHKISAIEYFVNSKSLYSINNWTSGVKVRWPLNGTTINGYSNASDFVQIYQNFDNVDNIEHRKQIDPNYWGLLALVLVFGTATGNILVCLAIVWERRLQNVTNYFLMSLAITDLMVAILVMPLGILTLVKGEFYYRKCRKIYFNHSILNLFRHLLGNFVILLFTSRKITS